MAKKANNYISTELEWAEEQLASWKAYVDKNPMHELADRIHYKETRNGGMIPMVTASIEQQGKFIQETMKNYLALLEVVDKLREKEQEKIQSRGKGEVKGQAAAWVKAKNEQL
jgi:hypothetical protein